MLDNTKSKKFEMSELDQIVIIAEFCDWKIPDHCYSKRPEKPACSAGATRPR